MTSNNKLKPEDVFFGLAWLFMGLMLVAALVKGIHSAVTQKPVTPGIAYEKSEYQIQKEKEREIWQQTREHFRNKNSQ